MSNAVPQEWLLSFLGFVRFSGVAAPRMKRALNAPSQVSSGLARAVPWPLHPDLGSGAEPRTGCPAGQRRRLLGTGGTDANGNFVSSDESPGIALPAPLEGGQRLFAVDVCAGLTSAIFEIVIGSVPVMSPLAL